MPATPSQLRRPIFVDHTVDFGDGVTVSFRYDRNKMTETWMKAWMQAEQETDGSRLNEMLDDLIDGWDIQGDDGAPYPKNPDAIGFLFTVPDKGMIFTELLNASVPSRAEGNASVTATSTPPTTFSPPPASSPNGTPPSQSPTPSAAPSPT